MSWKATDITCSACGKPLRNGRVVLALKGDRLGSRVVVECSSCGWANRLTIKEKGELSK